MDDVTEVEDTNPKPFWRPRMMGTARDEEEYASIDYLVNVLWMI